MALKPFIFRVAAIGIPKSIVRYEVTPERATEVDVVYRGENYFTRSGDIAVL
jgi:hypothetical protein